MHTLTHRVALPLLLATFTLCAGACSDQASGAQQTCIDVLACLERGCARPGGPPPPPKLDDTADTACLAACTKELPLEGRGLANALLACATAQCAGCDPVVEPGCFEACLWETCTDSLVACAADGATGAASCATGHGCVQAAAATGSFVAPLRCLRRVAPPARGALTGFASCVEAKGAAACGAGSASCACAGVPVAPPAATMACAQARAVCALDSACQRATCRVQLSPGGQGAFDAWLVCVAKACPGCPGAGCGGSCAEAACLPEQVACLADPCPSGPNAASGDAVGGRACIRACGPDDDRCCVPGCFGATQVSERAALQTWLTCVLQQCATESDPFGSCAAKRCGG